ncbi:PLP-dependent transferase [Phlegmacium glaucopus]|nr:PLP-dependent transferase [Phlegmacium glaucopus]
MATSPLGFRLSRAALTTISPPIPRAYEWALKYPSSASRPLLDMSQGAPGIPPPKCVQDALAITSSSPGSFGYSLWDGELGMRKALVEQMKCVYGVGANLSVDDVALTAGCNLAFVAAIMALADAGDEVVLPVPWYFNHQMALNLLGIKTVALKTLPESGFMPSVERCRDLITPKTRAIVLITPNNPTGATYSPSLISEFSELAREKNLALIIDETYRDFLTTTNSPPHYLFTSTSWRSTFIHLFSFSKSYCLPGHRLGAIVASPFLLNSSLKSILDTVQICPPRPVQLALAPLLPELRTFLQDTAASLKARHMLFSENLPKRWKVGAKVEGGYFAFVRHPFQNVDSETVCKRLAQDMGVLVLPGSFFRGECSDNEGADRWIRFSVANVDDGNVKKVCERLAECEKSFGWSMEN